VLRDDSAAFGIARFADSHRHVEPKRLDAAAMLPRHSDVRLSVLAREIRGIDISHRAPQLDSMAQ
jgi:hypothetical protein